MNVVIEGLPNINGRKFTLQWYVSKSSDKSDGFPVGNPVTLVIKDVEGNYTSTFIPSTEAIGDFWYFFEVKEFGDNNGETVYSEPATSDCVLIRVTSTGIALEGSGTETDPYLLQSYDDLKQLHNLVNEGISFNSSYFKMTTDIPLKDDWTPMGVTVDGTNNVRDASNLHAFGGVFDGSGHTLLVATGGYPLLGYVNDATVKNLNIYGEQINGYGLINNLFFASITVDNITLKTPTLTPTEQREDKYHER